MSSNTTNLSLLKEDPAVDGNNAFNIKTMLNDNWDKVDAVTGPANATNNGVVKIGSGINVDSEGVISVPSVTAPVQSVNSETGTVVLTASDVGAETPTGSQAKADVVQANLTSHLTESAKDYVRSPAFGAIAGTVNAYTFNANVATSLIDGMAVYLDNIIATNTGASTFNWSGLGVKPIVDSKGVALTAGKMTINCIVGLRYNASTSSFQLLGEGGDVLTGNLVAGDLLSGKTGYSNNPLTKITGTATVASLGGKKFATGTMSVNGIFNITGLTFVPSLAFGYITSDNGTLHGTYFIASKNKDIYFNGATYQTGFL